MIQPKSRSAASGLQAANTGAPLIRRLGWSSSGNLPWPGDREIHLWCLGENSEIAQLERPVDSPPERGSEAVVGKQLLRTIIGWYHGVPPRTVGIAHGTYGKPHVAMTSGTRQLHFNVAHCDSATTLCFAAAPVGIDVEDFKAVPESDVIGLRYFNATQLRELESANSRQRDRIFLQLWTETEAYVKAIGCGISALDRKRIPEALPDAWTTLSLESQGSFLGTILARCHVDTVSVYSEITAVLLNSHEPLSWKHESERPATH